MSSQLDICTRVPSLPAACDDVIKLTRFAVNSDTRHMDKPQKQRLRRPTRGGQRRTKVNFPPPTLLRETRKGQHGKSSPAALIEVDLKRGGWRASANVEIRKLTQRLSRINRSNLGNALPTKRQLNAHELPSFEKLRISIDLRAKKTSLSNRC